MLWRGWLRSLAVALVMLSVSSGLGSVPAGRAVAAGTHPLQGHGSNAQGGITGRALPAGLAPVLWRVLGSATVARGSWYGHGMTATNAAWSQRQEITASDGTANDAFGASVVVSGNTALVGAPNHDGFVGAAYVFVRRGAIWTQQAELTAGDGASNDAFGDAVAFGGNTALVGAPFHGGAGAAYAFVRHGTTWSQQAEFTARDSAFGDRFGWSMTLSGSTALVGAWAKNHGGAAYVFARRGATWAQQAKLTISHGALDDRFGWSVALSGSAALIGAPDKNNQTGVAYVFVRHGNTWSRQAVLTAGDGAHGNWFGYSVALDNGTALIGATGKSYTTGAAYIYVRRGTTWTQQAELTATDGTRADWFGYSVALSGNSALVGAVGRNNTTGAAYVFVRSSTTWSQPAELTPGDGVPRGAFGQAVALNGGTALIGASGNNTGAAYVFVRT